MHRIYEKPLGYAGDYEMVSMILRAIRWREALFSSDPKQLVSGAGAVQGPSEPRQIS